MKAIVYRRYGTPNVLELTEIDKPIPKDNEVLIKMRATTVTSGDSRMRRADPFLVRLINGFVTPKTAILGMDLAGEVESVGKDVKLFSVGDHVLGSAGANAGAYAEYICLPEDAVITKKLESISFEDAAALFFGGHSALHFLRKGQIKEGQKVLIYGASGSLGTYAVQLAVHFGARVTGVCSTANTELVKSIGADRVIDYTTTDFAEDPQTYDIIFDTVGKSPFSECMKHLNAEGYYLRAVHMDLKSIFKGIWTSLTSNKKVVGGVAGEHVEDLNFLVDLVKKGSIKPVIDRIYPLEEIQHAHAYVDSGRKKGNVVITFGNTE